VLKTESGIMIIKSIHIEKVISFETTKIYYVIKLKYGRKKHECRYVPYFFKYYTYCDVMCEELEQFIGEDMNILRTSRVFKSIVNFYTRCFVNFT